ncbi:AAA family ATPase [Lebetimonas sp. JS032]|uniref:AAA family ATPase n=1 Tax=Lebetimonas sp. JS032 TaxID=990070 RepID=UPI000463BDA3|nr:AAA family ATPase [Lebetimonas sp. JS032]
MIKGRNDTLKLTKEEKGKLEINKILKLFGFTNFMLEEADEKGFYKVVRENGSEVNGTLSEGESTFLDVKNGTNGIKQIFILTHNVYFFKEVTFKGGGNNKWELLWRQLDDIEKINTATIFNTLRRILEYYFNILGDDLVVDAEPENVEKYLKVFELIFEKMGHKSNANA